MSTIPKPTTPKLSHTELRQLIRQVNILYKRSQAADNMVSEQEAANLLGIKKATLQNKVSTGELDGLYTVSPVNKSRFYYRDKIMGL